MILIINHPHYAVKVLIYDLCKAFIQSFSIYLQDNDYRKLYKQQNCIGGSLSKALESLHWLGVYNGIRNDVDHSEAVVSSKNLNLLSKWKVIWNMGSVIKFLAIVAYLVYTASASWRKFQRWTIRTFESPSNFKIICLQPPQWHLAQLWIIWMNIIAAL